MGNILKNSESQNQSNLKCSMESKYISINEFKFMDPFEENSTNGLYLNNTYLPEEIISDILSYIPPKHLLKLTLVCKKWCNVIKSQNFWMNIYNRDYPNKAKKLPWYVFYCYFTTNNFDNLIKNGNGQNKFEHWKIIRNYGDEFKIENPPVGSDPLPLNVPEFYGHTSCFVTTFQECVKMQIISLKNKRLLQYILVKFMPHIYISEWVTGRVDCGCTYRLVFKGYDENYNHDAELEDFSDEEEDEERSVGTVFFLQSKIEQVELGKWKKVELLLKEYPANVASLVFEHSGCDTQFWRGHYGSKMAGGVVRIVFDSIEPLGDDPKADIRQLRQKVKTNT